MGTKVSVIRYTDVECANCGGTKKCLIKYNEPYGELTGVIEKTVSANDLQKEKEKHPDLTIKEVYCNNCGILFHVTSV